METETGASYTIKTDAFEGPFGLLLSLVEEKKLFINDVSLADVTEDYLKYVNNLPKEEKEEIASFILVAATLILIKSKSILPNLTLSDEEESDIKKLEDRLRLYELYSGLSAHVRGKFGKDIIFPAEERKQEVQIFLPDDQISQLSMLDTALALLNKIPTKTKMPEVEVKKVISIEEMIAKLTNRIESAIQLNFKEFAQLRQGSDGQAGQPITKEEKVFVIVGFLAMLELVRTGILEAMQDETFSDIIIEKQANQNHESR